MLRSDIAVLAGTATLVPLHLPHHCPRGECNSSYWCMPKSELCLLQCHDVICYVICFHSFDAGDKDAFSSLAGLISLKSLNIMLAMSQWPLFQSDVLDASDLLNDLLLSFEYIIEGNQLTTARPHTDQQKWHHTPRRSAVWTYNHRTNVSLDLGLHANDSQVFWELPALSASDSSYCSQTTPSWSFTPLVRRNVLRESATRMP